MKKFLTPKWLITAYFIILGILLTVNILPPSVAIPLLTIAGIFITAGAVLLGLLIIIAVVFGCIHIIKGQRVFLWLLVLSLIVSCKKEKVDMPDATEMGKLIGMDMNVWHVVNNKPAGMVPKEFNSVEEAKVYFAQYYFDEKTVKGIVKPAIANKLNPDDPQPTNTVTLTTVLLYTSYSVTFSWLNKEAGFGIGGGSYGVTSTTSHMGGVGGVAWGWNQTGTSYYNLPNSSVIHIVITAVQSFNFKIKAWDGIYQHNMRIEIDYNAKTGGYTMNVWNNAAGH